MNHKAIRKLVLSGLFAAITAVVTYFPVPFPIAHGYINLGDCFVILSGLILGPAYGFLAGGIGSCLADLILGYASYAPATFIIKGVMAITVWLIAGNSKKSYGITRSILASITAEVVMVLGYFAFELVLYGSGAVGSLAGNCFQGICCAIAGTVISAVMIKTKIIYRLNP